MDEGVALGVGEPEDVCECVIDPVLLCDCDDDNDWVNDWVMLGLEELETVCVEVSDPVIDCVCDVDAAQVVLMARSRMPRYGSDEVHVVPPFEL